MNYPISLPARAVGIDIGKKAIHVCVPALEAEPRDWHVVELNYADNPAWHTDLANMLAPGAIVCFEPTGYHLAAPIITVLTQMTDAQIWLVGHGTTGRVREVHISRAKTDAFDARAIALIATWIADDNSPPAHCRRHNLLLEEQVQELRTHVNELQRLTKATTRLKNRLHAYAHAMHPALDIKFGTWLKLATGQGIVTPAEIKAYAANPPENMDGRNLRYIKALAEALPDIVPPPYTRHIVYETLADLDRTELRIHDVRALITHIVTSPPFDEVTRRVLTIPGSGDDPVNIAPFHVAAHGLLGQMTADEFKACVGISAKTDTSGSIDKTRAMKGGYSPAGTQLFMWAMRLLQMEDNPVSD